MMGLKMELAMARRDKIIPVVLTALVVTPANYFVINTFGIPDGWPKIFTVIAVGATTAVICFWTYHKWFVRPNTEH
jgi:hypothetical protein